MSNILQAITLRNFKGVRDTLRVELKPITLLFGPNSAGKSSILQALHYLREVLERGNLDSDTTISGGALNLGGFASLVHQHDLGNPLYVKVEIGIDKEYGDDRLPINAGEQPEGLDLSRLRLRYAASDDETEWGPTPWATVQDIGVGIEVRWSELLERPYVSRHEVFFNGEALLAIVSPPQPGRAMLTDINFDHPLLQSASETDGDPDLEALLRELSAENIADEQILGKTSAVRIPIRARYGALIDPATAVSLQFEVHENEDRYYAQALSSLFSEWLHGPSLIALDALQTLRYIGPLREVPERGFRPQASPEAGRWATGLAAWDLLHSNRQGLVERVDDWMVGAEKLDLGYGLARREFREIETPGALDALLNGRITEEDQPLLQEYYAQLPTRVELSLYDANTRIALQPQDVGVGLSQLIPIIVAAEATDSRWVAMEQPELHLHPAIQVAIGDLFIAAIQRDEHPANGFLIETHSEHLMLRFLRRIRETTDDELPPGVPSLRPEQLAVYFVESTETGIQMTRIGIDEDGEFTDRWPRGFFGERRQELL